MWLRPETSLNPAQHTLVLLLRVYRRAISPGLAALFAPHGLGCRFSPTCSQYTLDAVRTHGAVRGVWLGTRRLCRCHPWGGCGHDPVPPKHPARASAALTSSRHGS